VAESQIGKEDTSVGLDVASELSDRSGGVGGLPVNSADTRVVEVSVL